MILDEESLKTILDSKSTDFDRLNEKTGLFYRLKDEIQKESRSLLESIMASLIAKDPGIAEIRLHVSSEAEYDDCGGLYWSAQYDVSAINSEGEEILFSHENGWDFAEYFEEEMRDLLEDCFNPRDYSGTGETFTYRRAA